MAVKVYVERTIIDGFEETVWQMLRELRSEVVRQHGHLYSETWRSLDDSRVYVAVSVWSTREHWEKWFNDEFRQKMDERINRMLVEPSMVKVFGETIGPPNLTGLAGI